MRKKRHRIYSGGEEEEEEERLKYRENEKGQENTMTIDWLTRRIRELP